MDRQVGPGPPWEEQALVLAHEQAHIARQDSRLNGVSAAAQCLCWFNPLAHLAAHLMRIDQELACDVAVVTRFPTARRAYAEVLLKAQLATLPLPLGCYWPSKTQHPLVERVAMLKLKDISRVRRLAGAAALAALCAGSALAAWAAQPADVRVTAGPARDAAIPSPPPRDSGAADRFVIQHVVIEGAGRIGHGKVRSALAIMPGQTMTAATLKTALNRLQDTGLVGGVSALFRPSGDLVVRVTEKRGATKLLIADDSPVQSDAQNRPIQIPSRQSIYGNIQRVVVGGAQRIDQETILSKLAIRPGQMVTTDTLAAGLRALYETGQFADVHVQGPPPGDSGDLIVRVSENPPKPPANVLGSPIDFTANTVDRRDNKSVRFAGHAEAVFSGHHLMSDVLDVVSPDKVGLVMGKAPPPNGPAAANSQKSGPKQMTADGNVSYLSDTDTVEADHAVYDLASGAITFTGNVDVVRGQAAVKDGKLVLPVRSGAAAQTGPSTENAIRRWIAAVQMHQTAEAVMSPALIEAARQQQAPAAQIFRAFGALQSVRFVRVMPGGVSNYEADFAHGKLNLVVGPLTADGKLDELRWGPIWAKDGERPRPGVPLAP